MWTCGARAAPSVAERSPAAPRVAELSPLTARRRLTALTALSGTSRFAVSLSRARPQLAAFEPPPSSRRRLEPPPLRSAAAPHPTHVGLVATANSTYNSPFNLARRFASLDHSSGGRAGWNVVTSFDTGAARNFGLDEHLDYPTRY